MRRLSEETLLTIHLGQASLSLLIMMTLVTYVLADDQAGLWMVDSGVGLQQQVAPLVVAAECICILYLYQIFLFVFFY